MDDCSLRVLDDESFGIGIVAARAASSSSAAAALLSLVDERVRCVVDAARRRRLLPFSCRVFVTPLADCHREFERTVSSRAHVLSSSIKTTHSGRMGARVRRFGGNRSRRAHRLRRSFAIRRFGRIEVFANVNPGPHEMSHHEDKDVDIEKNDWKDILASCRQGATGLSTSNLLVLGKHLRVMRLRGFHFSLLFFGGKRRSRLW